MNLSDNGPTNYTIYLVNHSPDPQTFWSFLDVPVAGVDTSKVFANSNSYLTVEPNHSSQINTFTIPLQYKLGVGASNKAVKLKTKIKSSTIMDVGLGSGYLASYYQGEEHRGPDLDVHGDASAKTVIVTTNEYDKAKEATNHWFGNMSFGVESNQGFMGVSWEPDPQKVYTITPHVNFYVQTGVFQPNHLADINSISQKPRHLTDVDFDEGFNTTVVYDSKGNWRAYPGMPKEEDLNFSPEPSTASEGSVNDAVLMEAVTAQVLLAEAQRDLVNLLELDYGSGAMNSDALGNDKDKYAIEKLTIDPIKEEVRPLIKGSIKIGRAIATAFGFAVISGITLEVRNDGIISNRTTFNFQYRGTEARQTVIETLRAAREVTFYRNRPPQQ